MQVPIRARRFRRFELESKQAEMGPGSLNTPCALRPVFRFLTTLVWKARVTMGRGLSPAEVSTPQHPIGGLASRLHTAGISKL